MTLFDYISSRLLSNYCCDLKMSSGGDAKIFMIDNDYCIGAYLRKSQWGGGWEAMRWDRQGAAMSPGAVQHLVLQLPKRKCYLAIKQGILHLEGSTHPLFTTENAAKIYAGANFGQFTICEIEV